MIQACGGCGTSFDSLQGKYAPDGSIVCAACGDRLAAQNAALVKKSAGSSFIGAFGSLLIAFLSFAFENRLLFFLFPLMAIAGGVGCAYTALRSVEARAALGWKRVPTIVVGGLAAVLGLLSLIVAFAARSE